MIRVVVGIILAVLFVLFVSFNSDPVSVSFVFVDTQVGLVWVFLACALVGALIAYLIGRPGRRATRKYIGELERRVDEDDKRQR